VKVNALTGLFGKLCGTVGIQVLFGNHPTQWLSRATRTGANAQLSLDDIHATAMYRRRRKPCSEAQRRHDSLLHRSRCDPHVYTVASQEGVSETVRVELGKFDPPLWHAPYSRIV